MNSAIWIVGGAPRSGKKTTAKLIAKQSGFDHFSTDAIVSGFAHAEPERDIHHLSEDDYAVADRIAPFLHGVFNWYVEHQETLVLDGLHVRPSFLRRATAGLHCKAVFLGYPNSTPDTLLVDVRRRERACDWTRAKTDDDMIHIFARFISASKVCAEEAAAEGYNFFDINLFEGDLAEVQRAAMAALQHPDYPVFYPGRRYPEVAL